MQKEPNTRCRRLALISLAVLVLMTGSACSAGKGAAPTPTATAPTANVQVTISRLDCEPPADIQITEYDLDCHTPNASTHCGCGLTGMIENSGGNASGVSVIAEFYDFDEVKIAEGTDYIGQLRDGQYALFNISYSESECPYEFDVWVDAWTGECNCELTGTVKNLGDDDATGVTVEAMFLDAEGVKLGDGHDYVGDLLPGQSAYFDVWYGGEECPASYVVWAER